MKPIICPKLTLVSFRRSFDSALSILGNQSFVCLASFRLLQPKLTTVFKVSVNSLVVIQTDFNKVTYFYGVSS